jgi:oligopeptide transport system substrate-binding protein
VKKIWVLGLIFTLVISVLAVGQVKTLYWNLGTEPPALDPNIATDTTSIQVIQALFLGLTDFDDATMEVVPELLSA